jgi:hypothetical protein
MTMTPACPSDLVFGRSWRPGGADAYEFVVSNCHGRRSGPIGADNGVWGAVVCDKGEYPELRFKSSKAARHALTDRPGKTVSTRLDRVLSVDSNVPGGRAMSSHLG